MLYVCLSLWKKQKNIHDSWHSRLVKLSHLDCTALLGGFLLKSLLTCLTPPALLFLSCFLIPGRTLSRGLVEGNPETQRAFSVEGAGRLLVGMLLGGPGGLRVVGPKKCQKETNAYVSWSLQFIPKCELTCGTLQVYTEMLDVTSSVWLVWPTNRWRPDINS